MGYELVRDFYSKKLEVTGTLNLLKYISKVTSLITCVVSNSFLLYTLVTQVTEKLASV